MFDADNNFQGCLIAGEATSQPPERGTGSHLLELQIIDYSKNPLQLILKEDRRGQKKIRTHCSHSGKGQRLLITRAFKMNLMAVF